MKIRNVVIGLLLLTPLLASAEGEKKSQFIGAWCSNPCFYGTTSRPWNLPCAFVISKDEIRWAQWNDKKKKFIRKYIVVEQKEGEETLLVNGGSAHEWYAHESVPNAKHRLTFSAHHSNQYARDSIELNDESWNEKDKKWTLSGSMFVRRNKGPCP